MFRLFETEPPSRWLEIFNIAFEGGGANVQASTNSLNASKSTGFPENLGLEETQYVHVLYVIMRMVDVPRSFREKLVEQ